MLWDVLPFYPIDTNTNIVLMVLFHQNGNTHHALLVQSVHKGKAELLHTLYLYNYRFYTALSLVLDVNIKNAQRI